MKTITATAIMAALVVIPLILKKCKVELVPSRADSDIDQKDDVLRYDIYDFLS